MKSIVLRPNFKYLVANGSHASLLFEAENGNAIVTLKSSLVPSHVLTSNVSERQVSSCLSRKAQNRTPAYFRRQERRKVEREKATTDIVKQESSDDEVNTSIVDAMKNTNITENRDELVSAEEAAVNTDMPR